MSATRAAAVVFDLDGTLLDSDDALAAPFVALGVARENVTFGHVVADECARLGFTVDDYLERYDPRLARPFEGVEAMLATIEDAGIPWAVCSNKVRRYGTFELDLAGWRPAVALFADDFGGPKRLRPVLDELGMTATSPAESIWFVGDTAHDARCAREGGARFAAAHWNLRARGAGLSGDAVCSHPSDLLAVLGLDEGRSAPST